jgi:UDP-N-acetylglucosamine transferase subunit ALG13
LIFVTVGTHEQPFDRLIKEVDRLIRSGVIKEDVFVQRGIGSIVPRNCQSAEVIPHDDMMEKVAKARVVITHGGPGSIMLPLPMGKVPIVVPRQAKFNEHVDNHQVDFTRRLEREKKIIAVYEIETLEDKIIHYDKLSEDLDIQTSHSAELDRLIENLKRYTKEIAHKS